MPVEQQPPDVVAMIVADAVLRDVATGKYTIQGTYLVLGAPSFPYTHPSVVVYAALTEGYGATTVKLRLVDVDEVHPPPFELDTIVDFPDPLAIAEVVFAKANVVFPEPGEYRFQLFGAGELLRERRLQMVALEDADGS